MMRLVHTPIDPIERGNSWGFKSEENPDPKTVHYWSNSRGDFRPYRLSTSGKKVYLKESEVLGLMNAKFGNGHIH